jgi:hypothetical protein
VVSSPAVIDPGVTATVTFTPRTAGTFMYLDPRNAPVNRVLGLHGAFVVLPAGVEEGTAVNTPYTEPSVQAQRLFDDLGSSPQFPGDPWIPLRPEGVPPNPDLPPDIEPFLFRTRIWLFLQVDPRFNAVAEAGGNAEPGGGIDPVALDRDFLPRYFLISGKSGAFAAHDHAIHLEGFVGEPCLVRCLNAGLGTESLHLHANHFGVLAIDDRVQDSVRFVDTMTVATVEGDRRRPRNGPRLDDRLFLRSASRVDFLVPFIRPPDVAGDPSTPLRDLVPQELALILGGVPQSPLQYPMHNHTEPSQTAAGGNYPQGSVTHLTFFGDLDKIAFPVPECDSGTDCDPSDDAGTGGHGGHGGHG